MRVGKRGVARRRRRRRCAGRLARRAAGRSRLAGRPRGSTSRPRDAEGRSQHRAEPTLDLRRRQSRARRARARSSTSARSARSTTAASTSSCLVDARRAAASCTTPAGLGVTVPFYFVDRLRGERRRRRDVPQVSPAPVLGPQRRRPVPHRVAVGPRRERALAHVVRSGTGWEPTDGTAAHRYHIRYAESRRRHRVAADGPRLHRLPRRRTSTHRAAVRRPGRRPLPDVVLLARRRLPDRLRRVDRRLDVGAATTRRVGVAPVGAAGTRR